MNIMRIKLIVLGFCSALLWGCGDAFPPSPDPSQGIESFRLAFTEVHGDRYWSDSATVVVTNPDGSGRTEIAPGTLVGPVGTDRVAFVRGDSIFAATWQKGKWDIRLIFAYTGDQRNISYASVALSPDGRFLTFTTQYAGDYLSTYLAAADGSGTGIPLPVAVAKGFTPVFSSDSRKMAFYGVPTSSENSFADSGRIYVLDTDGSGYRSVADLERVGADGGLTMDFSPDGRRIAYSNKNPATEIQTIYIANTDGSASPREFAAQAGFPVWSHDGSKIFYTGGFNFDLLVKNADGSGTATNLTNTVGQMEVFPQLSPDGSKLTYALFSGNVESSPAIIKVMDVNNPSNINTICNTGYRGFWLRTAR